MLSRKIKNLRNNVMEEIPYRNTKLPVKTIPKGTLLFRVTDTPENDLRGVPLPDGTRCITPNFNVFFYGNPFVWKMALEKYFEGPQTMHIYTLSKDVKVLNLVAPSKYSRLTKNRKKSFIQRCSTIKKGCMPKELNSHDACFSKKLVEAYPYVVGMLSISFTDGIKTSKYIKKHNVTQKIRKYIQLTDDCDKFHSSPPELILHPLEERPSKNIIVNEDDTLQTNYSLLKSVKYSDEALRKFMDSHALYDPQTLFFKYQA